MTIDELSEEILLLSKESDANFLKLSRLLAELHELLVAGGLQGGQEAFLACLKAAGIGRRKAYYFLEIDSVYGPMKKVSRKRLAAVGWTKLSLMAKYVDADTITEWLKVAETSTADQLRAFLVGKDPPSNVLTFKLSDSQFGSIAGILLAHGAYLVGGGGLGNKEAALVKVCKNAAKAIAAGVG